MKRVAVLISGGGSNMIKLVESMAGDHPARPALVLSNNAHAGGLEKAARMGIETAVVDHRPFGKDRAGYGAALQASLDQANVDVVCLAGFMRILAPSFTARWQGRMLNIHPSLLPKYKGLHTHKRALEAGDQEHGCSVHEVTADLDDGPILGQAKLKIQADDTAESLAQRVLVLEHDLYPKVLYRFITGNKAPLFL